MAAFALMPWGMGFDDWDGREWGVGGGAGELARGAGGGGSIGVKDRGGRAIGEAIAEGAWTCSGDGHNECDGD